MPPPDLPTLPRRRRDTSKRDYGRVVVVGGAAGMAGAPALAASAALRSGAGLVEALVPEQIVAIAASFDPCVMTRGLPGRTDGTFATDAVEEAVERIQARAGAADAVAVGPGVGRSDAVIQLVARLWQHLPQPAVFDADALWALAHSDGQLDGGQLSAHAGPRILTPHAGEMLRLLGGDPSSAAAGDRAMLEERAATFATTIGAVVVLKGPATLITDGGRRAHNDTGNPGMATAGTGDVLTGVVAALLAQGLDPFASARLAAWVHGRAGDVAAEALGEVSMTARDLLDRLPVAFREVSG
jgi:ADP-dependent NAD(P)H-hydrate dehydratase